MVIVYVLASILGSVVTFVALSSYGWAIALLCAPWGGSAVAGLAAVGACILKAGLCRAWSPQQPGVLTAARS
jgi:hypothetical protein